VLGGHVFSSNALKLCSAISLPVGPVIPHSG
jgi:hypothetical protein